MISFQRVISRYSARHHQQRSKLAVLGVIGKALTVCVLSISTASAQNVEPGDIAPFEAVYEVGNHLINAGTAKLTLDHNADLWSYSLTTTPRGIIKLAGKGKINESSTIKFTNIGDELQLQPQTYQYRQDNERRRAVDANFDWDARTVTYTYRGKETTEEFEQPIIDRLTATLLMMDTLRKGKFDSPTLKVFDTGQVKDVAFIDAGNEMLDTPLGEMSTIRIVNHNAAGGSRQTTTWFAPSLDYVPVKIEHRKRGELVARLNLLRLNNRVTAKELKPKEN